MIRAPYYDAKPEYYEELTVGMSDKAKQSFANALAHHMIPIYRNSHGWWLTRYDYLMFSSKKQHWRKEGKPLTSLVDNEGTWHYYKEFEED